VPFRTSHDLVGKLVLRAEALGVPLSKLGLSEYQAVHPAFAEDVYAVYDFQRSVEARQVEGGTAPQAVNNQIAKARDLLAIHGQNEEAKASGVPPLSAPNRRARAK
jgi:argininosuccinate lyase